MLYSFNTVDIDEHISEIRPSLLLAGQLREELERLYRLYADDPEGIVLLKSCQQEAERVEDSIRFRIRFLQNLLVETQQTDKEIKRLLEDNSAVSCFES